MPRKKVHKSGIDSTISDAERFPLFESLILAAEPDNDGKTESVRPDDVAIRQYAESTIAKKEAGISDRTLYLFGKAESGEEMTGAEFDELERGMRAQGLDDLAIQQQRDIYNSQRLRRRNTEAIMNAGGGALRAPDGSLQIVHPSTKNPGQYQVSKFGMSGITGDSQFGSIEDAVRFAQGTGHTELVSGEAANDALIQAIEAESSRGAQQTEPRAVSHPDPAIDGKNVLTETQDGRVIEAMASHEKPPRSIQRFERPGGEQSQAAQKQPWQMTRAEYYLQENGPIVAAIQDAMRDGRRIELRTQYRITPLRSLDHVRLTSRGEVQIREGKEWVTLFDSQIDNLARQAGMELPPYLDRTFHINYVEEALREGKPVTREVLADYPSLRNQAEDEDELRGQNEERLKADTLSGHFSDLFTQGRSFSSITEARKVASDFLGKEIKPGTIEAKETDEAVELGVVLAARKIVVENHGNPQATYAALVDLYNRQPNLNVRTSTSVANQAYSTPVPIAYVALRLAGIDENTTVDEPTAGNGALLIAADPENVHANELDPKRAQALRVQGFSVTTNDATAWTPKGKFDVVIANPPFGVVKNDLGASISYTLLPNFRTTEIDQAIAFKALEAMKNDGRAVLILGGLNKLEKTREARSDGYNVAAKRRFYYYLYQNYNVVDHFTVAGELYEKQGAGWPIDVIVIDGRGRSSRALPAVDVPRLYESFDGLRDVLDQAPTRGMGVGVPAQPGSVSDTGRSGAETRSSGLPDTAGRPDRGYGERVGEPERSGDVPSREPRPGRPTAAEQTRAPGTGNEQSGTAHAPQRTESVSDAGRGGEIRQPGGAEAGEGNQPGAVARPGNERISRTSGLEGAAGEASGNLFGEEETQPDLFGRLNAQQSGATEPKPEPRTITQVTESAGKTAESEAQSQSQPQVTPQSRDTDTHRVYKPASNARSVDTLVPINMATATANALARLEEKVGSLDNYVADKLGYDPKDIEGYFSAEQVDALALAISNIESGAGFVIGDQTGIGKGRVVAGIIRYAMNTGKTPIFVTEKPPLYGDMIRDLTDIGIGRIKPLITNANEAVPLDDEALAWAAEAGKAREDGRKAPPRRGRFLETADSKQHKSLLNSVKDFGLKAAGYDAVFTTYNQLQKIRGESAARHDMLERLADGGVAIFDESHNAGGSEPKIDKQGEIIEDRARFARKLARKASAVFYSSATYAKRPEVMDLYFKTDLSKAVDDISQLPEVIKKGGIPLQQVVASMLSEAGQYIRRERSFAGVNYDVIAAPVDKEAAETVSSVLSGIVDFDVIKQPAVEAFAETIKGGAQALGVDGAMNVESANFTALMHNVIDQMLLNLKVDAAANEATAALKRGEKPVITVSNTMGAFLDEYAADNEIRNGDPIKLDFSGVLMRYLERSRRVTIKRPDKTFTHHYLSDDELGPSALGRYNEIKKMIEDGDFSGMAISPIDRIHQKIRDAGYSTAEITGRNQQIDYSGPVAIFRTRPGQETSTIGKKRAINGFNDGSVHALIINQSGSTGISLHASEKFKNQQRRHMIIAQAEKNVDTHMQMIGRVHRTGQVAPPRYTQLAADIPAEKRPAAVLAKKMASLNANTTAARGSAVTAKDVVDFLNEFGDKVAANLMREDQNLWLQLGQPAYEDVETGGVKQDAMRRITGRIPILPIEQQEAVYKRLEDEYRDYIAFLEATGANTLEAKTLDLQAETRSTDPLTTPKGGDSPFTRASAIEKARVRRLGKPMTSEQVAEMVCKSLGEQSGDLDKLQAVGDERAKELMEQMTGEHANFAEQRMEGFQLEIDGLREKVDKTEDSQGKTKLQRKLDAVELRLQTARADTQKALLTWRALVQTLHPGSQVRLNTEEGSFYGVAVSLERKGEQKNPVALSGWRVNVAVADGARSIQFPLSQVITEATQESHGGPIIASYADSMPVYNAETGTFDRVSIAEAFDKGQSESMETRNIVTGNIMAGFEAVKGKGQIVNYTDKDGNVRQGILMPRDWDREKELKQRDIVFKTADQALEFLSANGRLKTRDGDLVLMTNAKGDLMLAANKAKSSGGKYYLNKKIIDAVGKDFVSGGGMMRAPVSKDEARKVIDLLASGEAMGQPTLFLADNMPDKAREIVERSKGEGSVVEAGAPTSIGERLKIDGISLEARKHAEDLAEQWVGNENTIQRRDAKTEGLMTALQTIANIEAPDPSGRRSLKELSGAVGRIALAAITNAGGPEAIQDKEVGAALGKIAGIMVGDQQGRLLSLQERIDEAVKIASATIGEIESRMLAQSVMVNAVEMAQTRQPSTPGHGIGW